MTRRVVVVGGGHNGLVCAAYLARAGLSVRICEAKPALGGGVRTEEFAKGFKVSSCAHLLSLLDPRVVEDLQLFSHGLRFARNHIDTVALSSDGAHVVYSGSRLGGAVSSADQARYGAYAARMRRLATVLQRWYRRVPPRFVADSASARALLPMLFELRQLGRDDLREFLRILPSNIFDLLEQEFDSDLLKGALCFDGVRGSGLGPRSNNTVLTALHQLTGEVDGLAGSMALPLGGMGTVSAALTSAAQEAGVDIQTDSPVRQLVLRRGAVAGVMLEGGKELPADIVVSNADPKRTLLELVGVENLDVEFAHRIRNIRMIGFAAKLHVALDGLPPFADLSQAQQSSRLVIAPDPGYVERAFDEGKYGGLSKYPALEVVVPTACDSSLAPAGKHVLSIVAQYAPFNLKAGWSAGAPVLEQSILETLEAYAPGISTRILATQLLTPVDIEERFGCGGGHWHHGELALDQFFSLRPVPMAAQYEMPVGGLYLCGAGAHPGGGVMGTPGRNAAGVVLAKGR